MMELAIYSLHSAYPSPPLPSLHAAPLTHTLPETLPIFQSLFMIQILSLSPITIISRPRSARRNNNPIAYSSREQMSSLFHAGLAAALAQFLKPQQVTSDVKFGQASSGNKRASQFCAHHRFTSDIIPGRGCIQPPSQVPCRKITTVSSLIKCFGIRISVSISIKIPCISPTRVPWKKSPFKASLLCRNGFNQKDTCATVLVTSQLIAGFARGSNRSRTFQRSQDRPSKFEHSILDN